MNVKVQKANLSLVGGPYYTAQGYFPLGARSNNNGSSWSYPITANKPKSLPPNISITPVLNPLLGQINYFIGSSCSGNLCAMGGRYLVGNVTYPMLAISKDGGLTWSYPINSTTALPGTMTPSNTDVAGFINGVYCLGSLCAAAGQYHTAQGNFPLLALTLDAGHTWTYPISALKLPKGAVAAATSGFVGSLQNVFCTGTRCLVTGQYNVSSSGKGKRYPLLGLSTNSGASWSYPLNAQSIYPGGISVPASGIAGNFSRILCVNEKCILSGTYRSTGDLGTQSYIILGYSANGGASWIFPMSSQSDFPNNAISTDSVTDMDCYNNRCMVGGYYSTNTMQVPLLMLSENNGKTWNYVVQDGQNLPQGILSGYINSVTCSSVLCFAGGGYVFSDNAGYPFVVQNKNGSPNWIYVVDKNNMPADAQPDVNQVISINSTSGTTSYGMAAGYYFNGSGYFPLIAVTQNGGGNWSFPVTSKSSSLPSDAVAEPSGFLNFFSTATTSAGQ
ncbi:sialidase family protein [Legionella sp. km772]|uniref:sialidase family protein n=1 Tax=Legionella sp. km772 TaxID=2498111 RepID=UPI000F8D2AA8|nr:sialidase family protein [Legionella sp. km772]RUR09653.1 hypothetical protein ELY15_08970 [Legionella sp. km772]